MGNRYTPETGYPTFDLSLNSPFEEDDVFVFVRGEETRELTGFDMNAGIQAYRKTEAGQMAEERRQGLRAPLFTVLGASSNPLEETRVVLGNSDVEVTEFEQPAVEVFRNIQGLPE